MAVIPVRRLLLNMAWPMMLSMLIQALYNLVDSMFVAQLSSDGFVALALVYPIQTLMIAACVGTGVGFNALLALLLGALRPSLVWLAFLLSEGAACLTALLLYRRTARGRLAGMEE